MFLSPFAFFWLDAALVHCATRIHKYPSHRMLCLGQYRWFRRHEPDTDHPVVVCKSSGGLPGGYWVGFATSGSPEGQQYTGHSGYPCCASPNAS